MKKDKFYSILFPIITFGCILTLWAISANAINSEYVLPSVSATFSALFDLFKKGEFYTAYALTFLRSLIAFLLSFTIAFLLAYLVKKFRYAGKIINPIVSVIRCLPTIAVVLLLMFWTNSQIAPVIVTMMVVLPTLYTNVYSAFDSVDKEVVEMCEFFKVDKKKIFLSVKLPAILPSMLLAIGSGLALNIKLMVAAEVLASTANSIGNELSFYNYNLEVATMIALVLITVITGVIIEGVFRLISKKVGKWK